MNWEFNNESKYKKVLDKVKEEKRADIHSFHRYYGKLIPAIPRAYIELFTKKGDTIADLFSGSGTVAVESKLLERNFIGCEINPLSSFIANVKTYTYDYNILKKFNEQIEIYLYDSEYIKNLKKGKIPFCVNLEHWFRKEVIDDLLIIRATTNDVVSSSKLKKSDKKIYIEFYDAIISSIIRNVSNADPRHVFPGISKRIRALEAEGKINKDAKKSFINAIKRKSKYFIDYQNLKETNIKIINGDSVNDRFTKYKNSVDLFVTNPPYISSVRYIETMKLEMYWLEYLKSQAEYSNLAKIMVGNDKVSKKDIDNNLLTSYSEINEKIQQLREIDSKSAYIVAKYFNDMEKVIKNMYLMLKNNGKVVVKISESKVKKIKIDTGKFLTIIAEKNGFKLVDVFLDKINENSRSLTTARNTYSDIILNDNIIIWEKCENE